MSVSRSDLIEMIATQFGPYTSGTATGGSTTTLIDTAGLYEPDDYWNGHYLYITDTTDSGDPKGEERPITDYGRSSATLETSPAFSASLAAGDTYEILSVRRAQIVRAIDDAIRNAGDSWLVYIEDSSTVDLADDTYSYSLPADLVHLLQIWVREDTDDPWKRVPEKDWYVGGTPGAAKLYFHSADSWDSDQTLRLDYLRLQGTLVSDSDTLDVGSPAENELVEFIVNWSLGVLHTAQAASDNNPRLHLTLAQHHRSLADECRRRVKRLHPRGKTHPARWSRSKG